MNKKIFAVILPIILILCGCSKDNVNNNNKEISSSGKELICVNWLENIYPDGAITQSTDYSKHMYFDFENMEQTVFCSKPNCMHNNSECISNIVGECPILYNDYVYFFTSDSGVKETKTGREFYIDSKLNRISLETSEIETVSSFTDCEARAKYLVYKDILYFCGHDLGPTKDEFGNIFSGSAGGTTYICSIDLKTGEYKNYGSVYDGDKQYEGAPSSSSAHISGFYDSKIFIEYSFAKNKLDDVDFSKTDPREIFTVLNFEFDPETGEIKESDLPSGSYIRENTYVYSNYPENSSTVLYNGDKYIIDSVDSNTTGKSFNYKLFLSGKWYDIKDGTEHIWNDKYKHWQVVAMYKDCYIIANPERLKFEKLTEEELLALDKEE